MLFRTIAVAAFSSTLLFAQDHKQPAEAPKASELTIVEIAANSGSFSTLVTAVKAAGLAETLSGKGPFTVFAPTDEAFAKLGKDTIADLLKPENKQKLIAILTYHVAGASLPAAKVVASKSIATLQGSSLPVAMRGDDVMIGTAKVLKTDIVGLNGIIHVIDSVLLPVDAKTDSIVAVAQKTGGFTTLLAAATAAGLAETLAKDGPFTVFAPTDEAFAKLGKDAIADLLKPENKQRLADILKFHVVAGAVPAAEAMKLHAAKSLLGQELTLKVVDGKLQVAGATVVAADVLAKNGVIHVVDRVLLPHD